MDDQILNARTAGARAGGTVRITLIRSLIGSQQGQIATIKALGLHRIRSTVERPDSPVLRGMIFKVKHLVAVEDVD